MSINLREKSIEVVKQSKEVGIGYLNTRSNYFNGEIIESEKGDFTIFGLCDYLKIMPDERIKSAGIEAIKNHGINFAVSRAYIKLHLYKEAEENLVNIFNRPVALFARTSLAHVGAIPALVDRNDAIIYDQQVHATLQTGIAIAASMGVHVEIIRHNHMDMLEARIKKLRNKYNRIWYFADGIYSMYGDSFAAKDILTLLNKYEQLRLYIDDAHGMSWTGKNGSGHVLSQIGNHPQMILAVSLGKGFGAGGGVIVCPDEKTKDTIIFSGGPLMFSSPIEPSMQGAIIASSKIHLSKEIYEKQSALKELMVYFYNAVGKRLLPVINKEITPIAYFPTGKNDEIFFFIDFLQKNGFITTAGIFPAVSLNNTGVRVQIALYQTKDDIDHLLDVIEEGYKIIEKDKGISTERILKFFKH